MTDEEMLRALVIESSRRWVAQDVEALVAEPGSNQGYGYRARDARTPSADARRVALEAAFKAIDFFRVVDQDINVLIDGDTAVVWGAFTEDFQNTGQPPEVVRVRFSNTAVKRDGEWRFIWGHRDAQPFDDDGRYIRRPS